MGRVYQIRVFLATAHRPGERPGRPGRDGRIPRAQRRVDKSTRCNGGPVRALAGSSEVCASLSSYSPFRRRNRHNRPGEFDLTCPFRNLGSFRQEKRIVPAVTSRFRSSPSCVSWFIRTDFCQVDAGDSAGPPFRDPSIRMSNPTSPPIPRSRRRNSAAVCSLRLRRLLPAVPQLLRGRD